jgi:hypothetical protein
VQPFLLGHKLQCLIEKSFFFNFTGEPGEVSTRISAGSPVSGHLTTFLERKSFPIGINTSRLPMASFASVENRAFTAILLLKPYKD